MALPEQFIQKYNKLTCKPLHIKAKEQAITIGHHILLAF